MRRSTLLALVLLLAILFAFWRLASQLPPTDEQPDLPSPLVLIGEVRDDHGPLGGARVRLQATRFHTETDSCGRFQLRSGKTAGINPAARPGDSPRKVTAWKPGYFIGSSRPGTGPLQIRLEPLPTVDQDGYQWVDAAPDPARPQNCGNCHAAIYREWQTSGHSRSVTGYHFRDLYNGTDRQGRPGVGWGLLTQYDVGAAVCASCHAPALAHNDPASSDLGQLPENDSRGSIHCDFCHKIADAGRDKLGLTHGRYNLRLLRPSAVATGGSPVASRATGEPPVATAERQAKRDRQLFFGPLDDVDRGEDIYAPVYRDSVYCASCHEGVVFGVHVYSTYSEWLDSPAQRQGRHCQDCHMKPTGHMTNIAPGHGGLERDPATLGNHRFFAGSQADMLRRCLRVNVEWKRAGAEVQATARVGVEGVGHRVPTGLPDRHLLLLVEGLDGDGKLLQPQAGPTLPPAAGEELAGRPGRLYAKLLKGPDGRSPAPFWRADPEPIDNRLTPGKTDEAVFHFGPQLARVRVRVLYRRFWQEVIRVKGWPDRDLVVLEPEFAAPPP